MWVLMGCFGCGFGGLWASIGALRGALGVLWGSLGTLGGSWGVGGLLGVLWVSFGGALGVLWASIGPPWGVLWGSGGGPWGLLGGPWGVVGILDRSRGVFREFPGKSGISLGSFGRHFWSLSDTKIDLKIRSILGFKMEAFLGQFWVNFPYKNR